MHIDGSDNIKTTHELVLKQFHISVNKKSRLDQLSIHVSIHVYQWHLDYSDKEDCPQKGLNGQIRHKDRLIT